MGVLKTHSQGGEQEVLADLLPDVGRFLDIGAHDGRTFSNTLGLAEQGWAGVCVEPAPSNAARLLVTHKDRPEVEVVSAAIVVEKPGWATFWDTDTDVLSTLDTVHRDFRADGTYAPMLLHTVSLASLLKRVGYDFDFVSIDTEGTSVDLASALPLARMGNLRAICVERDRPLSLSGFDAVWEDGNNVVFGKS